MYSSKADSYTAVDETLCLSKVALQVSQAEDDALIIYFFDSYTAFSGRNLPEVGRVVWACEAQVWRSKTSWRSGSLKRMPLSCLLRYWPDRLAENAVSSLRIRGWSRIRGGSGTICRGIYSCITTMPFVRCDLFTRGDDMSG